MPAPQVHRATVVEDTPFYVLSMVKVKDSSHNLIGVQQSDISTITRRVSVAGVEVLASTAITISTSVLNTVSTGNIFVGTAGFNFIDLVPATAVPDGNKTYRVEYIFTLTSGVAFPLLVDAATIEVVRS